MLDVAIPVGAFLALTSGGVMSALMFLTVPGVVITLDRRAQRQRSTR